MSVRIRSCSWVLSARSAVILASYCDWRVVSEVSTDMCGSLPCWWSPMPPVSLAPGTSHGLRVIGARVAGERLGAGGSVAFPRGGPASEHAAMTVVPGILTGLWVAPPATSRCSPLMAFSVAQPLSPALAWAGRPQRFSTSAAHCWRSDGASREGVEARSTGS